MEVHKLIEIFNCTMDLFNLILQNPEMLKQLLVFIQYLKATK